MLLKTGPILACALTLGATFLVTGKARAISCDDVDLPNKVYGVGGSAVTGTLKAISLAITKDTQKTAERTTIIYHDDLGACAGYAAFLDGKVTGSFRYWIEGSTADQRCDARIGGQPVDFSHMGNDWDFCPDGSLPDGTGSFTGPIQTLNFVTAKASNQLSISA